jgi:acetyl-CoA carboxylase biotin carboxyl carrier protein
METPGFDVDRIARLAAFVQAHNLDELVLEEGGTIIRIRGPETVPVASEPAVSAAPDRVEPGDGPEALPPGHVALGAPMMGVFYRSQAPHLPPLVEVGDRISVGQPIGVIEAMKVFSEVPAEAAGVVVAITAANATMVRQGTPLVIVRLESPGA